MPKSDHQRQLTPVLENYLEIIFYEEIKEGAARPSAIADRAGVSRSTVTSMLKTLKNMGYVEYAPYSLIHLTEEGSRIGRDIAQRHLIFQEFFEHVLQLEPALADSVACELEHVVPTEVIRRMGQFVLYFQSREDEWKNWRKEYAAVREQHIRANKSIAPGIKTTQLSCRARLAEAEDFSKYR